MKGAAMRLEIPMTFSKTTKNKIVFATNDGLAPTSNVYILAEFLRVMGADPRRIVATLCDAPYTDEEVGGMLAMIKMRPERDTKYKTVFAPADAGAPVESLYVVTEWLRSHDFGDVLYLGIADAASVYEAAASAGQIEHHSPDDAFDAFLGETVVRIEGSVLTTAEIRKPWAARNGADFEDKIIAGIHKNTIARRFRKRFGAPAGKRGRVNGKIEYYWKGYGINEEKPDVGAKRRQGARTLPAHQARHTTLAP